MRPRVLLAFALVCTAGGADITFTENYEIAGVTPKQERTTSVSGSRLAIDSNDITFIIDPTAKTVTEVDRARAEFSAMPAVAFQTKLASAREDLRTSVEEDFASHVRWSGVEVSFPAPEPGPRILNVNTQWFRWTFKAKMESTGQPPATLTPTLTMTNECAIGKPEGWEQIRRLQSVDFGAEGMPLTTSDEFQSAAKQAIEHLAAMEGAIFFFINTATTEMPSVGGVDVPAADVETRS